MDAVSTVLPGVAGGPAPAVDADGQSPEGIFPAALEQALAQPVQAPTGSTPPVDAGQVLPVQAMKAVAEPGLIALPVTAGAIDIPAPEAGQASPVVAAAPDPAAVVDALDDIATGQNAGVAAAVQAPAVSGVPIRAPVGNSPTAMAGVIKVNVAQPLRAQGRQAEQVTDASALPPPLTEPVAVPALVEGMPVAGHKPVRRLPAADSMVVSPPLAELALPATATETTAAGQGADAGPSTTMAGSGRNGSSLPQPAERPAVTMPTTYGGSEAALAAQGTGSPDPSVPSAAVPGNELAAAALVSSAPHMAAPNSAPSLELPLAATPGSPEFSHELGERLLWLVREGVHEARLQLNPRELGPIEVRLGVSDGAAQVSFSAQHAGTAAAVQQSLPQLRELLAQQGLQLGQADVSQQQPGAGQQTPQQERSAAGDARGPAGRGVDEPFVGERVRVIGRGLVDAYA